MILRVAEKRAEFPVVAAALERGELTLEQADVVVTKAPSWADGKVLDFVKEATVNQLRRTITDQFFDDGPSAEQDAPPPVDRLAFGSTTGDRWRINGNFDVATGRRIEAALTECKDSLFERGDTDATWADALVEMAETSLDAVESESRRDRYRTWLHVDVSNGDTTTTDGWRIPMAVRERLLCDGVVQPSGSARVCRSPSVGRSGSFPPAPVVSSNVVIVAAVCRGARPVGSSRCTTSSTGSTAARPTPGTWVGSPTPSWPDEPPTPAPAATVPEERLGHPRRLQG